MCETVPDGAMKVCFQIAKHNLFLLKTVPASAMRACYQIAERSLFYLKTPHNSL
jgi:hypothetical protein